MINKTMSSFLRIVISCSILIVVYSNTFLNLNNVSIIFEKPPVSFFIVSFNWLIAALLTKNYDRSFNNNFKEFSNPFFKSYMIILVFSFPFIDDTYLLMQFISGFLLLELFMFFLIHKYKMWFNFKNKISHIVDFGQILENQQQSLQIPDKELFFVDESISSTLNNVRSNNSVFSKKMGATKESQTSEDRLAIKEIHSDTDFENLKSDLGFGGTKISFCFPTQEFHKAAVKNKGVKGNWDWWFKLIHLDDDSKSLMDASNIVY